VAVKKGSAALWWLPSNHQNLLFMLGSGLITGPKGFEYGGDSKYYKDALSQCPGWIPLYRKHIPDIARSMSIEESPNLVSVIAGLNLNDYQGDVYTFNEADGWELVPFESLSEEYNLVLVPAPLPASWIVNILFQKTEDKDFLINASKDFANIDISEMKYSVKKLSVSAQNADEYDFNSFSKASESDIQIDLTERAQAIGGIVAMLYQFANRSDLCTQIFLKICTILLHSSECEDAYSLNTNDHIIKWLPYWLAGKGNSTEDMRTSFFFGLLEDIIKNRKSHAKHELTSNALWYVNNSKETDAIRDSWRSFPKFIEELSRPSLTIIEQFEKFKGTISHALLLFFQREDCGELLEFPDQNPLVSLNDSDIIAAALLFGAREGWLGLAKEHKQRIYKWTTSLMALEAHQQDKPILRISVSEPNPLRMLFIGDAWNKNEKYALAAARECKWDECILQTMIKLPKSYCVENGFLVLPGDIKDSAIKSKIDRELFLKRLSAASINEEQKIREKIWRAVK